MGTCYLFSTGMAGGRLERPGLVERVRRLLVLPTIVFAQFAGTSLWFAPNAILPLVRFTSDGRPARRGGAAELALLTSLVQAGYVVGTLVLAYLAVADRLQAERVFAVACALGALTNGLCATTTRLASWAALRLCVGVCLAGIYPVGMKVAARQFPQGLGGRMGVIIGGLVFGTAFPWLLALLGGRLPYEQLLAAVSALAALGGLLLALVVGAGPVRVRPTPAAPAPLRAGEERAADALAGAASAAAHAAVAPAAFGVASLRAIWASRQFRAAACGYFGHMWELYGFWVFVPELVRAHAASRGASGGLSVELASFVAIAVGAPASALVGVWSLYAALPLRASAGNGRVVAPATAGAPGGTEGGAKGSDAKAIPGSAVVAMGSLLLSGLCCLLAPLSTRMSTGAFATLLVVWGSAVVADSGQFSALCAKGAPSELVGTALTLTTCAGFALTIASIQMVGAMLGAGVDAGLAMLALTPGPACGLAAAYVEWPLHRAVCARPR
ncbi:hypothetical protein KFE25_006586 [Diacronema lutheri]|uniref:Uncharacterized protein n=1 Tax=Diacronema lutheri TaxID=2081491 RepID=A0A8J5X2B9_DIALT|nr:hypothetical protein KFE25_006586 [Diacronema lutheri]